MPNRSYEMYVQILKLFLNEIISYDGYTHANIELDLTAANKSYKKTTNMYMT